MDGREYSRAAEVLVKLFDNNPQQYRFGIQLAYCYKALKHSHALKSLVDSMILRRSREASEARRELKALQETVAASPDTSSLDSQKQMRIQTLQRKASTNFYTLEFLLGYAEAALGNSESAVAHFARARAMDSRQPELYLQLGRAYLQLRQWAQAEECFRTALELDEDLAGAQTGLCRCFLARQEYYPAINCALASVGLIYFNPYAHFLLGVALQ
jgi:tetratricopeptide (TPR) repeat protein